MNSQVLNMALSLGLLLSVASIPTQSIGTQAKFAAKIFETIAQGKIDQNVIISPASIQTCLALAYIGAEGKTATEMRQALNLGDDGVSKVQVAQQFENLLSKMRRTKEATLKMANRVYVKNGLQIATAFNDLAQRYFDSGVENVDFTVKETADKINTWIEQRTENKIQNVILPNDLTVDTAAVLVNAIYFKAKWSNGFKNHSTTKKDFHLSKQRTKKVDMMYQRNQFPFADLPNLDAKALALGYIGTDIKMLVLLPNQLDGLGHLEQQLREIDLTKLLNKLRVAPKVHVFLPKFRLEFDISLVPTLKALGMRDLFSETANFSSLFTTSSTVAISDVKHKAFIEVNEEGTEAAASTVAGVKTRSIQFINEFNANHPFFFALLDNDTVYFAGHVANI